MPDFLEQIFSNVWSIALVVFFFAASVFVHELGHFLAARRRGLRVDRFSIGFGPKIFGWTRDGVEYRVSWIPLGGYVALPQLADMSGIEGPVSEETEKLPPVSYSSKMLVLVMGAVFNVLFAFGLASLLAVVGLPTSDAQNTTTVGYVSPTVKLGDQTEVPSPAAVAGLREGDRIVAIDGNRLEDWNALQQTLVSSSVRDESGRPRAVLTIERDGVEQTVEVFPRVAGEDSNRMIGIQGAVPLIVLGSIPNSPAAASAIQRGDKLLRVDGVGVFSRAQLSDYVLKHADRDVVFTFARVPGRKFATAKELQAFVNSLPIGEDPFDEAHGGVVFNATLHPEKATYTTDGLTRPSVGMDFIVPVRTIYPNPLDEIAGNFTLMSRVLRGLLDPRSDIGLRNMSGAPGIFRALYSTAQIDIRLVIWVTMLININLAVFNLLPIPVLDGGHMLFATVGKLRGRALPARLIASAQSAFMVLLLALMAFVGVRDIGRWTRDAREDRLDRQRYLDVPVFEKRTGS